MGECYSTAKPTPNSDMPLKEPLHNISNKESCADLKKSRSLSYQETEPETGRKTFKKSTLSQLTEYLGFEFLKDNLINLGNKTFFKTFLTSRKKLSSAHPLRLNMKKLLENSISLQAFISTPEPSKIMKEILKHLNIVSLSIPLLPEGSCSGIKLGEFLESLTEVKSIKYSLCQPLIQSHLFNNMDEMSENYVYGNPALTKTTLDFRGVKGLDPSFIVDLFASMILQLRLEEIRFYSGTYSEFAYELLGTLDCHPNLTLLSISMYINRATYACMERLPSIISYQQNLKKLNLTLSFSKGCKFLMIYDLITAIGTISELEELKLKISSLEKFGEPIKEFANLINFRKLRHLSINLKLGLYTSETVNYIIKGLKNCQKALKRIRIKLLVKEIFEEAEHIIGNYLSYCRSIVYAKIYLIEQKTKVPLITFIYPKLGEIKKFTLEGKSYTMFSLKELELMKSLETLTLKFQKTHKNGCYQLPMLNNLKKLKFESENKDLYLSLLDFFRHYEEGNQIRYLHVKILQEDITFIQKIPCLFPHLEKLSLKIVERANNDLVRLIGALKTLGLRKLYIKIFSIDPTETKRLFNKMQLDLEVNKFYLTIIKNSDAVPLEREQGENNADEGDLNERLEAIRMLINSD